MSSHRTSRRSVPVLALLALIAALVAWLAVAPSVSRSHVAQAATPKPNCGSGYRVISRNQHEGGYATLRFRDSDRTACFSFTKTTKVGVPSDIGVRLYRPLGKVTRRDRGSYTYFAGPIYVHVPTRYSDPACAVNTWYVNPQGEWRQYGYFTCAAF